MPRPGQVCVPEGVHSSVLGSRPDSFRNPREREIVAVTAVVACTTSNYKCVPKDHERPLHLSALERRHMRWAQNGGTARHKSLLPPPP